MQGDCSGILRGFRTPQKQPPKIKHSQRQRQGVVILAWRHNPQRNRAAEDRKTFLACFTNFNISCCWFSLWDLAVEIPGTNTLTPKAPTHTSTNLNPLKLNKFFFSMLSAESLEKTFRVECGHACHVTPLVYDYCLKFCGSPAEFRLALWNSVVNYFKTKVGQSGP